MSARLPPSWKDASQASLLSVPPPALKSIIKVKLQECLSDATCQANGALRGEQVWAGRIALASSETEGCSRRSLKGFILKVVAISSQQ